MQRYPKAPFQLTTFLVAVLLSIWQPAGAELTFQIDTASQVDGSRVYRHTENFTHHKQWKGAPKDWTPSADWFYQREEGAITVLSGGWFLQGQDNYELDDKGNYHFKPDPKAIAYLDAHVGHPRLRIWINGSSDNMPGPLIEGGFKAGAYLYNARQPNDYEKWRFYLESMFQWMVDRYGREEVKRWAFQFGFESDWQTKAVYPGTQKEMNKQDNLKEFLKMLDYWHAAATTVIGKSAYVGCYYALVTQAPPYYRHFTEGTNYVTGETGTNISFLGFSDWYHIGTEVMKNKKGEVWYDPDKFQLSPFTEDQGGEGEAHSNAYVGGMKFKYDYLERLIDHHYPQLDHLDFYVPEAGFIQHDPKGFPAPLTFANHHGAALYALRSIAYAHFPRIMMAGNNFALSTGTRGAWYKDDAKAAVFHNSRFQLRMDGQRLLPVAKSGQQKADTEIRAIAVASDSDTQTYRVLATNFLNTFHKQPAATNPENTETLRFQFNQLPDIEKIKVDIYRIDENHNNWWPDWRKYREEQGIEYAPAGYGVWAKYAPHFAPYVNDVMGTLKPKDRNNWLEKEKDYKKREQLTITETREIEIQDGKAELQLGIPESGVLYLEAHAGQPTPLPQPTLNFSLGISEDWDKKGDVRLLRSDKGPILALHPADGPASVKTTLKNLQPQTPYRLTLQARNNSRAIRHAAQLGDTRSKGVKDSNWHRLVLTATSNTEGELELILSTPQQPADPEDAAYFKNLEITKP